MAAHRTLRTATALVASASLVLAGCSAATDASPATAAVVSGNAGAADGALFDASTVHSIAIEVDDTALRTMLKTFADTGDKEWISATVTIDGQAFNDVGMKLKGNSSLKGVTADSAAESLPWRIRLDKFVDGQDLDGYADFTVRANSSETSLNEAVALVLLRAAGLASEETVATKFSVNGSAADLRIAVQNLDDDWMEQNFAGAGDGSVLYKSEAEGDWSWRGEDGDYSTSFEIEAGDDGEDAYLPLISLLDLVNNGTADEIAEKLPTMLDVESFARYLAFEDLIDNFDDIDGPGNNSYLFHDDATRMFTVVAWDHNLAFGTRNVGGAGQGGGGRDGAGPGAGGPGQRPTGSNRPGAGDPPAGAERGGAPEGGGQRRARWHERQQPAGRRVRGEPGVVCALRRGGGGPARRADRQRAAERDSRHLGRGAEPGRHRCGRGRHHHSGGRRHPRLRVLTD